MAAPSPTTPGGRSTTVRMDTGLRRVIGRRSLLFTGIGSIIGSGWLFGALSAAQIAGPGAIFSWIIGAVMVALIGLTFAELSVMFPVTGGVIRFPQYGFGSFAGFFAGWVMWVACAASAPSEVLAVIQYAKPYLPWLMTSEDGVLVATPSGLLVAIALMAVFSVINVLGVKAFVRFNDLLVWWKLLVIVVVIGTFFALSFNPDNLVAHGGMFPNGGAAVFTALPAGGIVFAYLGFRQGVEFAGESANPQRNVPFAVIGSIVVTGLLYVLLQIAFLTGLPGELLGAGWSEVTFTDVAGPLAGLATLLGATWLAITLYADAIVSPGDTGLIYTAVTTRIAYANAQNGNAPLALTKLNRRGVPWLAAVFTFVFGCVFFLPFPGWQKIIGFITSATVLTFAFGPVVYGALRRTLPDQPRPFRLPGGDTIAYLAFLSANLIVFWTGWQINEKLFLAIALGYIFLIGYRRFARRKLPALDLRAGSWCMLWIAGMAIISYFGEFGADPDALLPGGNGPIGTVSGTVIMAVFSAAIYGYAMITRPSFENTVANIAGDDS
ncbi:amino acid/polyamine/organocation transporter, APC superfamily [Saccharopolyspora shandongensis]|uniref:Amino acid/polyamine/organocation transporter, APC superfamily n=1 Tax=Saccharopolyspora shandongensis TaxID=418495 RepID=A0A1H3NAY6_9PSEU|nr:APC family permease [Saccharopolyspora shandongensis]SDY86097.1 amino acid/polyamine/organocation transporter, APC superfamily [Saccharopolyspora shandongensis]